MVRRVVREFSGKGGQAASQQTGSEHTAEAPRQDGDRTYVMAMYALFALAFATLVMPVAGIVLAYVKRGDMGDSVYNNHADYLIKTFWGGLAGFVLSKITAFIGHRLRVAVFGIGLVCLPSGGRFRQTDGQQAYVFGYLVLSATARLVFRRPSHLGVV